MFAFNETSLTATAAAREGWRVLNFQMTNLHLLARGDVELLQMLWHSALYPIMKKRCQPLF